jgi:hypothetical protein
MGMGQESPLQSRVLSGFSSSVEVIVSLSQRDVYKTHYLLIIPPKSNHKKGDKKNIVCLVCPGLN